jgi:hypothetical protein
MLRSFSARLITTIASASAIIATICIGGVGVFLISGADNAKAEPLTKLVVHRTYGKGDRLPVLKRGADCSPSGWPYYEPNCQYDMRRPFGQMPTVRVIALR